MLHPRCVLFLLFIYLFFLEALWRETFTIDQLVKKGKILVN